MQQNDYPALYKAADAASAASQNTFLNSIRAEYCLLILAALLSMNLSNHVAYTVLTALIFFVLLGFVLFRALKSIDRTWYHGRAVAESIKTLTWRYMMRAKPFEEGADEEFAKLLRALIDSNKEYGAIIAGHVVNDDEITPFMRSVRAMDLQSRIAFYQQSRVDEQRTWYINKARANKKNFRWFIILLGLIYLAAACSSLIKIGYPDFQFYPTDVMIAIAGALIGWIQIKKFSELSAAYGLTAHEIGLIKASGADLQSEEKFSEHVNDAEMAFSREHTQWIARQAG
ncbi:DUF4231 domain-containing protein [Rhizobium leguminosarum]|uniref:DUF4231 domain-containing protein n=1 Tax=Rhizobium leguminosarum TaxID=384 RepID=UPI0010310F51|nr:DUF4231 domain-containing protein [Rhizobium leguminosarum]TBF87928.1 DUF4231 domain-containing protein [Rhizobium leguminosarum]TBG07090.1 DUF4231 domain-containing protein [Rhizobium leguminosarum]TBG07564.1 DUF4231 domain-containing protein [Rhizobium leguminosarum]TBG30775.1 DUF4231 domain-containing protein [Rhizobium leguminosarum]TBG50015.1 DUF4231 domain-containing protein [Rhizobium leguminosarum]